MTRLPSVRGLLPALALLALLACGGDGGTEPEPVTVTISPASVTLGAAGTQTFNASVQGDADGSVTWSASEGTVEVTGSSALYTAPVQGGSYTVTATATADPSARAQATVTVTPVEVAVTPASAEVLRGERVALTASVEGVGSDATGVSWEASCGSVDGDGTEVEFVAPTAPGPCQVTATSILDPGASASATVTVRPVLVVTSTDDADDGSCDPAHCSLREALRIALEGPNPDTVVFQQAAAGASGPLRPSDAHFVDGTIRLTAPLPSITSPVVIQGPGLDLLTVDADAAAGIARRVLEVDGGTATVSGLTLSGGRAPGGGGLRVGAGGELRLAQSRIEGNVATEGYGGGLLVEDEGSTVALDQVTVQGNTTEGPVVPGGGLAALPGSSIAMTGGSIVDNRVLNGYGGGLVAWGAEVTLDEVTILGNRADGGPGGGGIFVEGATTLEALGGFVSGNSTDGNGGGIGFFGEAQVTLTGVTVSENSALAGGGIAAGGSTLSLDDVQVSDNVAAREGGGIWAWNEVEAELASTDVALNTSGGGGGGGIAVTGGAGLRLGLSRILENTALRDASDGPGGTGGGGIHLGVGTRLDARQSLIARNETTEGPGGGLFAGEATVRLDTVEVRDNVARGDGVGSGGGAALVDASTAVVGGRWTGNESAAARGGGIDATGGVLELVGAEVDANRSAGAGGGIHGAGGSVELTGAGIRNNEAGGEGGGIRVSAAGSLELRTTTVEGNLAGGDGGGIAHDGTEGFQLRTSDLLDNEAGGRGGGAWVAGASFLMVETSVVGNTSGENGGGLLLATDATVRRSTVAGNTATTRGGGIDASAEFGILLQNVTLSGNAADVGGAVVSTGPVDLLNATVVGNTATTLGGGIVALAGRLRPGLSLFAGNTSAGTPASCAVSGTGTLVSNNYNLSGDASCDAFFQSSRDLPDTDPGIDPTLADNGGPTPTHALLAGSAAIDAGNPGVCPDTDQRGRARVDVCDIGAFEFQPGG